jgi:uncharacterized protein YcgL (UPF0745 family)
MRCYVYRSPRKPGTYLSVAEKDSFCQLPQALVALFGAPEFALEFELTPARRLAVADAREVIARLQEQGYYLQMPSENPLPV